MMNLKTICLSKIFIFFIANYSVCAQDNSIFKPKYKFESKLKEKKRFQLLSWTEKSLYSVSDTIVLIIESNKMFKHPPSYQLTIPGLKKGASSSSVSINNGIIKSNTIIYFTPIKTGKIIIPEIETILDKKIYFTKKIKIKIIED